jgi:hypothetical protein
LIRGVASTRVAKATLQRGLHSVLRDGLEVVFDKLPQAWQRRKVLAP